ncbi:MAG: TlpA family protein disulfide reductase [Planctomycetota bacterium]|jgi:thiol-disulfide isomerase/thioredoxin
MRQLTAALAAGAVFATVLPAFAQEPPTPPKASSPATGFSKADPASFTEADRAPEAIANGVKQFARTGEAYRKAPALVENIVIDVMAPMGNQKTLIDSKWGADGAFDIMVDGQMRMLSTKDTFFMLMPSDESRYMSQEILDGNVESAVLAATGGGGVPDPAYLFRVGDPAKLKPEQIPGMFGLGAIADPKLTGFRKVDAGFQAMLEGEGGQAIVSMNAKTGLVDRIDLKVMPPGMPAGAGIDVAFTIKNKIEKMLATAIAFDTAGKTRVDRPDQLGPQPLTVGAEAPDFELKSFDGETVRLSSLRGQVVVLDFWATWCGPCKRGLPVLNEVVKWAAAEGLPVKFFGVNSWEQGEAAAKLAGAKAYWDGQKFAFQSLFDSDDSVIGKYGVTGIPTSFIIGRDGKVEVVHQGFDPAMVDTMKAELKTAAGEKG